MEIKATFLLYPQENINQVVLVSNAFTGSDNRFPLLVLLDGAVHELSDLAVERPRLPHRAADGAQQPRRREHVADAHAGLYLVQPNVQHLEELVPSPEALAHDGAQRRVGDERRHPLGDVHGGLLAGQLGRGGGDGGDEAGGLVLADGAERTHARGAEQLGAADPADVPPPVTVRREGDPEALVRGGPYGQGQGPRRERGVVRPQNLPRRVAGREHHGGDLTELEVHDGGVVPAREVRQGAVNGKLREEELVEVADDRKTPWPRREPRRQRRFPAGLLVLRPEEQDH